MRAPRSDRRSAAISVHPRRIGSFPAGDRPCLCARLGIVADPRKTAAQLNRGRQFALSLEYFVDRCGFSFGDEEHPSMMGKQAATGKCAPRCWATR